MHLNHSPRRTSAGAWLAITVLAPCACDFDSTLAPRVDIPVVIDASHLATHETDLGYTVELDQFRMALTELEFTTEGEMHGDASRVRRPWQPLADLVIPPAFAHPGHSAGGEVVGELNGAFVFDWTDDGLSLGPATMLHAHYSGANFTFDLAQAGNGVRADDPMVGSTFHIAGRASKDGETVEFEAFVAQDDNRRVIGLPMDLTIDDSTAVSVGIGFTPVDPFDGATIFDAIDFAALDDDADGHVDLTPGMEAFNRLTRNLQTHDHYLVTQR